MSLYKCPECKQKMDENYHCDNCGFDLPISERITRRSALNLFLIALVIYIASQIISDSTIRGAVYLVVLILTSIPYFKAGRIGLGVLSIFPITTVIMMLIGIISTGTGKFKDRDKKYVR